jgi:MSHA biogenesis protein MshM
VLFGQPELDEHLSLPNIRQLRDRITHSFMLAPLAAGDIREYLMFRLRAAGYRGPDLFPDKVIQLITQASAGLTRRVNLLADKALLAAFSENTHTLKPKHVEAAIRDSEFSQSTSDVAPARRWGWLLAAAAGGVVGAAGYAWYAQRATPLPPVSAPSAPAPSAAAGHPAPATPIAHVAGQAAPPAQAPAEPVEKPVVSPVMQPDDILQARLDATTQWLKQQSDNVWTLQTLSTTSKDDLRNYLIKLKKTIEINNIFVYRNGANGDDRLVLSVLYGAYESRQAAEQKLAELPAQLKSNRPWPRTIESVRAEMR